MHSKVTQWGEEQLKILALPPPTWQPHQLQILNNYQRWSQAQLAFLTMVAQDTIVYARELQAADDRIAQHLASTAPQARLYRERDLPPPAQLTNQRNQFNTEIHLWSRDTLGAVQDLMRELKTDGMGDSGQQVCALNFASPVNPGGPGGGPFQSWREGGNTQEEQLFRMTSYFLSIDVDTGRERGWYPMSDEGAEGVYSPGVVLIRGRDESRLDREDMVAINFIAVPATIHYPAFRADRGTEYSKGELLLLRRRVRVVLGIAASNGQRNLVLGAWGCGQFGNDPYLIAKLFMEALRGGPGGEGFAGEFVGVFEKVVFAVIDDGKDNYKAFESVLCQ